jgi:hypothetical protein
MFIFIVIRLTTFYVKTQGKKKPLSLFILYEWHGSSLCPSLLRLGQVNASISHAELDLT